ncbi:MAG: polyprenyl synthetase family protein, partial [Sulfurospirillaceae bacterium]|nr:polyprenyl synthetase family protein [Sulfurospirillaceae bacterium]
FKEGKTTLPYLYMYQSLNAKDQEILLSLFQKTLNVEQTQWIKEKMQETNAINRSIEDAKKLGFEALDALSKEEDVGLASIIKEMIERKF